MSQASDLIQKVQVGARKLQSDVISGVGEATEFVRKNPVTSSVGVAGGVLAGITAVQIVRKARKKPAKAKKSYVRARPKRKAPLKRKKKPAKRVRLTKTKKWYGKSKNKKIYKTKKGQPYVLLASGKARFIKKVRATRMRKTKGGYK